MVIPPTLQTAYNAKISLVQALEKIVKDTVTNYCEVRGFLFEGRVKSLDSLSEKIETGRYKNFEDVDDLYACTIIIPLLSEEESVIQWVTSTFEVVTHEIKRRNTISKSPDIFRFDSTRIYANLKLPPGESIAKDLASSIKFEIQIKSVFEYAWTKTTHALVYKSQQVDWKRDRLVAQLKASVEQIEMLITSFDVASTHVPNGFSYELEDKVQIQDHLERVKSQIPSEVLPKDQTRFIDNVYRAMRAISGESPHKKTDERFKALKSLISKIEGHIAKQTISTFPRSISLHQYYLGVLCDDFSNLNSVGALAVLLKEKKFYPLITPELLVIFPSLNSMPLTDCFQAEI